MGGRLMTEGALYVGDEAGTSIAMEVGSEGLKVRVQHMVWRAAGRHAGNDGGFDVAAAAAAALGVGNKRFVPFA